MGHFGFGAVRKSTSCRTLRNSRAQGGGVAEAVFPSRCRCRRPLGPCDAPGPMTADSTEQDAGPAWGAGGGEEVVVLPWPLLLRRRVAGRAKRLGFSRQSW